MNHQIPVLCLVAMLALAGCDRAHDPDPSAAAGPPASTQTAAEPMDAGPAPDPAAPAGPEADPQVPRFPADGAIDFHGFGPAPFGADQEAVRMAWGRDLGDAVPAEPGGCYYLAPPRLADAEADRIAFMIEGDRFVRIDVTGSDIQAPGGGRVGMSADEVRSRYGSGIEQRPHKYVDGAHYLRIPDPAGGNGVLVFETGSSGQVQAWRIGVPPQVDWVERCG